MGRTEVRKIAGIFLGAALIMFWGTSGLRAESSRVFKVGILASQSGELKDAGAEMRRAVELFSTQVLSRQSSNLRMEWVYLDDESRVEGASRRVEEALRAGRVQAVVGPSFPMGATVSAPLFETAQVPLLVPLAKPLSAPDSRHTFYLRVAEQRQGQALAAFALKSLGAKTAVLVDDLSSDASKAFNDAFRKHFAGKNIKILARLAYSDPTAEASGLLGQIAKHNPDVIVLPTRSWNRARPFIGAASASGVRGVFLGSDRWMESIDDKEPIPLGHYFAASFSLGQPESRSFVQAHIELHKLPPTELTVATYEALSVLWQALQKSSSASRPTEAVTKGLSSGAIFEGVSGPLRFRSRPTDVERGVVILETARFGGPRFRDIVRVR